MSNRIVRRASVSDISGVVDVVATTFPQDFDYGQGFSRRDCEDFFAKSVFDPNEFVFIVEDENQSLVGFAYYINKPPTNGTALLEMQGIRPKSRRQGFATFLLKESEALLLENLSKNGINPATLHLTVSEDNKAARELYEKIGYSPVAVIPGLVGIGNNELVMLKVLNSSTYRTGLWRGSGD